MATYTRAQFTKAVLQEVGVTDATDAPEAEDSVFANDRTQQVFEQLAEEGLIPFDLDGVIPARYFLPLVRVVAPSLLVPYGLPNIAGLVRENAAEGMRALRRLRQADYIAAPTPATYY